jgi:hypothetical protein
MEVIKLNLLVTVPGGSVSFRLAGRFHGKTIYF